MLPYNNAVLKLAKRAETHDPQHIIDSFVDVGPLFSLLSNPDNQVIFGRRGTGKTHVLGYLASEKIREGVVTAQLDMRTIGSTGGIYADPKIPLAERATRLLVDTLIAIHDQVLNRVIDDSEKLDLSLLGPLLDRYVEAATELTVEGSIEEESIFSTSSESVSDAGLGVSPSALSIEAKLSSQKSEALNDSQRYRKTGTQRLRVQFGYLNRALQRLVDALPIKKLWVILDEWSEIPLDIQPYLADLFRRCVIPVRGITVKIAAIEQRCNFRIDDDAVGHIGIEIGADAAASISLDEFLVFENSPEQARQFFSELLYRHIAAIAKTDEEIEAPKSSADLISALFTQVTALEEFARSSEGVPRDAINIIGLAAQKSPSSQISVQDIRGAARTWYTRAKQQAISTKPEAQRLLNWIVDEVIKHRQARAFLLEVGVRDDLIDFLYDARVLHIIRQGVSSQDHAGRRFNVYALDYGCYVDLINTSRAPQGLFMAEADDGHEVFFDVPHTDFRSIRRAILDLDEFYKSKS